MHQCKPKAPPASAIAGADMMAKYYFPRSPGPRCPSLQASNSRVPAGALPLLAGNRCKLSHLAHNLETNYRQEVAKLPLRARASRCDCNHLHEELQRYATALASSWQRCPVCQHLLSPPMQWPVATSPSNCVTCTFTVSNIKVLTTGLLDVELRAWATATVSHCK